MSVPEYRGIAKEALTRTEEGRSGADLIGVSPIDGLENAERVQTALRMLAEAIAGAGGDHTHEDLYYTVDELDQMLGSLSGELGDHVGSGGDSHPLAETNGAAGFFSGAEKQKLSGVETGATADMTDAEILEALKRTDGAGNGIDADLLDGLDAAAFLRSNTLGTANGTAQLGPDGKLLPGQTNALSISEPFTAASEAAMLSLSAQAGDIAIRTDLNPDRVFMLAGNGNPQTLANWVRVTFGDVASVNDQVGVVVLTAAHVGAISTTERDAANGVAPLDLNRFVPLSRLSGITAAQIAAGSVDGAANMASMRTLGSGAQQAAPGNHLHDSRYVRTVNNTGPDANGNVAVSEGSGGMSDADILAAVLRVDGSGSGINADLLDGSSGADFLAATSRGAANGTAPLGSDSLVPEQYIPAVALGLPFEAASEAAMLALAAQPGDVAIRSDINKSFMLRASPASTLANWAELRTPTDAVLSVDGRVGAVSLSDSYAPTAHVGSGGAAHPAATQSVAGFQSAADKTKLDGLSGSAASETAAGIVELATASEATTGTDSVRAVHPAALKSALLSGSWITPSLTSGWTQFGAGEQAAQYRKNALGMIQLRGMLTPGTTGDSATVFTLPAGFRPAAIERFAPQTSNATPSVIIVQPDGRIVPRVSGGGSLSLSGISFDAA